MRTVLTILLIAVIGGICALEAVFIRQGRRGCRSAAASA